MKFIRFAFLCLVILVISNCQRLVHYCNYEIEGAADNSKSTKVLYDDTLISLKYQISHSLWSEVEIVKRTTNNITVNNVILEHFSGTTQLQNMSHHNESPYSINVFPFIISNNVMMDNSVFYQFKPEDNIDDRFNDGDRINVNIDVNYTINTITNDVPASFYLICRKGTNWVCDLM